MVSHGPRALYDGPETPTLWISESVTNGQTKGLTGVVLGML